jgi:hypothetical protein
MSVNLEVGHRSAFELAEVAEAVERAIRDLTAGAQPLTPVALRRSPALGTRWRPERAAHLTAQELQALTAADETSFVIAALDDRAWVEASLVDLRLRNADLSLSADEATLAAVELADPATEAYWYEKPAWSLDPQRDRLSYFLALASAVAIARLAEGAILNDGYGYAGDLPVQTPEQVVTRLSASTNASDPVGEVIANSGYSTTT